MSDRPTGRQDSNPARGTRDLKPDAVARREAVVAELAAAYARFGYRRIETPSIEDIDRLSWGEGGDNEKLIYRILRRGLDPEIAAGTNVSELVDLGLRYDLTVPLTRFYANNAGSLPTPFRAMQIGSVWRGERPAKGRYRQFTQCDIDILGEPTVLAESELLEATLAAIDAIGIAPVRVRVNDRRLLSAIARAAGVPGGAHKEFFVTLDKLDKVGWEGVRSELSQRGYEPAVGEQCEWLLTMLQAAESSSEMLSRAADRLPDVEAGVLEGLASTSTALDNLTLARGGSVAAGFTWTLDPTVVRGMGYYTGQIFEVEHAGSAGSIAGGGRYDGLVGRTLGREVPACGISIGFDRVVDMAAFAPPDLGVAVLHGDEPVDRLLAAARQLRAGGRSAALVLRRGQMKRQLEELQAEGFSSFVVIDGESVSKERLLS
ncbi:MAG TPA: ATP phosphoribosyltransferase regulatory subunit [Acidimicrobiales bacterium]|nr:ATP phosphoribosyltransferase regulatory subunit [Acidimicrobiales bacterium]